MAKNAAKTRAASSSAAERTLDRMIAEKQRTVGDGSLQVILAIASVTNLVTIDTTKTPPKMNPPNLGQLTFNDAKVGLSNTQMAIFKGNLATLLPEIEADVAKIPENAGLKISAVADFVRLALLAV
jgi:hypothetical protein